jgi:hypothetical protein
MAVETPPFQLTAEDRALIAQGEIEIARADAFNALQLRKEPGDTRVFTPEFQPTPTKPDGTPVTDLAGISGGLVGTAAGLAVNALAQTPVGQTIGQGIAVANQALETVNRIKDTARRVTGAVQEGATVLANLADKIQKNPLEVGNDLLGGIGSVADSLGSFLGGFSSASSSGPPYPNILDSFATYNCLWTLACLEPDQYNSPYSYRDNHKNLRHVVFSSAGRYDSERTQTRYGAPEYFVDNVTFQSIVSPTPASGNTNVFGFSFEIYEPFSMGLFLQSLQVASINAGYPNYLSGTPYLLMLQFAGNTDNGTVLPTNEPLTKYFTIQITKCDMTVDEGGSRYSVTAVPHHHMSFSDVVQKVKAEVKLTGSTVKEVLSTGDQSLVKYLNDTEEELLNSGRQAIADEYEIIFPTDFSDRGINLLGSFDIGSATIDPKKIEIPSIPGSCKGTEFFDIGSNAIGASPMPFKDSTSGNFVYKNEDQVIDAEIGISNNDKMSIDLSSREFRFSQDAKILQIIQDTILVSKYATDAVKAENLENGMANWFKIDVHIELLDIDIIRGFRARKYIFRVLPFLVSGHILKNPSAAAPGTNNIKKIIAKRYDYIYTGQNNHILKLDLAFNAMFFTGAHARPTGTTHTRDKDRNSASDDPDTTASGNAGGTSAITSSAGSVPVKNDASDGRLFKSSPVGDKTVEQEVADWFQKQFHEASSDLVQVEMEVLGDPYFLSDSGINTNYNAPPGPSSQIRSDGAMNYEGSDIFIFIVFRTPVEPNLATSGEGGLYSFPSDGISPFSGIYRLYEVQNKWANGTYTQTLKMTRVLGQDGDLIGKETITLPSVSVYAEPVEVPPKTSPGSDSKSFIEQTTTDPEKIAEVQGNASSLSQQTPGSSGAIVTTLSDGTQQIDVRTTQRIARNNAIDTAIANGASIQEAERLGEIAGNRAGTNALRNLDLGRSVPPQ